MKSREDTKTPKFQSLEEERQYWEARGPLAEGSKGRINKAKPGQKRSSFLAVRLTGEELTRLRDIAAKQGLGPSTFARLLLTSAMERGGRLPKTITFDELKDTLEQGLPQAVKDKAKALSKDMAIGDPDNPSLLIMDASQMREAEELTWSLLRALLAMTGVQVLTPKDARYEEVKDILKGITT